ncbi:MAG: ATP-binding protein [Thermoanaerobaculales bacterium]|nr:ATP-binding protein [Thermoanaerobaculales bacterium]
MGVLYGRRRLGKSRILREVAPEEGSVFFVGDDRDATLQRASLAREIAKLLVGFDGVAYPDWESLLTRWWRDAPTGTVLILDELPSLVAMAPELPSLLQKHVDADVGRGVHLLVAGSSQRMMQGLVLDHSAPLYGRATEILKIEPLEAGWIGEALELRSPASAVEAFAVWGGVPRYWELAADHRDLATAVRANVLDPLGVLHEEPGRLLLDDLRDTNQAASILSLVGCGCHRVSEIAGRMGRPATSLSRPLQRLMEMDLVEREVPFGDPERGSKRTLYRIRDPFLRFWFRFVEPGRSALEARRIEAVAEQVESGMPHHVATVWEDLARRSATRIELGGRRWGPARRWWGAGRDRRPLEVDLVAEDAAGEALLVGEVKWSAPRQGRGLLEALERKVERLPFVAGREVVTGLWLQSRPVDLPADQVVTPSQVLDVLR